MEVVAALVEVLLEMAVLRLRSQPSGVSHSQKWNRCCSFAEAEPLWLHVLLLPPWPHVHFLFLHAFLGGGT
ncbi:hypothetical protein EV2_039096 [Malus domestica]